MTFNRPPRVLQPAPKHKVTIPPPNAVPAKPELNWLTIGLPIVAIGVSIALMMAISPGTSGVSYLLFLPLMLAATLASVLTYLWQQRTYKRALAQTRASFAQVIRAKFSEAAACAEERRQWLLGASPGIDNSLQMARDRDPRLGERRPSDADFLSVRIGLGNQPSAIEFELPPQGNRIEAFSELYAQADRCQTEHAIVSGCPISADLSVIGCLGIASSSAAPCRDSMVSLGRAAILHLCTGHWPTELSVAVFIGSSSDLEDWSWVRQLPHASRLFSDPCIALDTSHPGEQEPVRILETEIRQRQLQAGTARVLAGSGEIHFNPILPVLVVFFDHVPDLYGHAAFSMLLKTGRSLGVYGVFLAEKISDLPSECGGIVDLADNTLTYSETGPGKFPVRDVVADKASIADGHLFAGLMRGIEWLVPATVTEPPTDLTLLDLFGAEDVSELPLEQWWDGEYPYGLLRAPIGRFTPTADLIFDLNDTDDSHGPHGIIGGTTGSGKSELLKTIVLALALTHHPYDLNFALIDYKGGGAFKELEALPHVVGVVTDIETHADYATRVIMALSGEIASRKRLLDEAREHSGIRRPHVDDYHELPVKRPLPRLVVIFDEFAEFKAVHPAETERLISIARQGRSLGIHLILCTQNPSTAVDDQVRQNSKFRMCMRVASPDDSRSLIGIPDAWALPTGQAFVQVKQPQKFKVAFTGARPAPSRRFSREQGRNTHPGSGNDGAASQPVTEAAAIVQRIRLIAERLGVSSPPEIWPPPLPDHLPLPKLLADYGVEQRWSGTGWDETERVSLPPILGLVDDPDHQAQAPLDLRDLGPSGNALVIGPSGSGKSLLLRTLAISLALRNSPDLVHIYCIDLGAQTALRGLADLPHVAQTGGVIVASDAERMARLFSLVKSIIGERAALFKDLGVSSLSAYNREAMKSKKPALPAVYVLIDGLNRVFLEANEGFDVQLTEVVQSGRSAGVHVVITASLVQDIPSRVYDHIRERLVLRQLEGLEARPPDYLVKKAGAGLMPPGRGFASLRHPMEFQTALPGSSANEADLSSHFESLIHAMQAAWDRPRPPGVECLPPFVSYEEARDGWLSTGHSESTNKLTAAIPLGVSQETCQAIGLSMLHDGPTFLVASSAAKLGKTSILRTWLLALAELIPPPPSPRNPAQEEQVTAGLPTAAAQFVIVDLHSRSMGLLSRLPHTTRFISKRDSLEEMLEQLEAEVQHRQSKQEGAFSSDPATYDPTRAMLELGFVIIVIDNFAKLRQQVPNAIVDRLATCIVNGADVGVRLLISDDCAAVGSDDVSKIVKKNGCGILFGGSDNLYLFNDAKPPYGRKTYNLPPGRGYIISRGHVSLFQAAAYWKPDAEPGEALRQWVERVRQAHRPEPGPPLRALNRKGNKR